MMMRLASKMSIYRLAALLPPPDPAARWLCNFDTRHHISTSWPVPPPILASTRSCDFSLQAEYCFGCPSPSNGLFLPGGPFHPVKPARRVQAHGAAWGQSTVEIFVLLLKESSDRQGALSFVSPLWCRI